MARSPHRHNEPALKYSITGTVAEGKPINVEFDGVIDGKPYKETGSHGGATVTYKRINDLTVGGTWTSADGKTTATFTVIDSKDGKMFTSKITTKAPEGEYKQLLVYESNDMCEREHSTRCFGKTVVATKWSPKTSRGGASVVRRQNSIRAGIRIFSVVEEV